MRLNKKHFKISQGILIFIFLFEIFCTPVFTGIKTNAATGKLKIELFNNDRAESVGTISPRIRLTNTTKESISLSTVKIRYFYTIDGERSQTFNVDWAQAGNNNVTGTFCKMTTPTSNADYYLEIAFGSYSGNLPAGTSTEVQVRFSKSDWTPYDQSNDYSFNSSSMTYATWDKASVFISGVLDSGTEPSISATPTTTNTAAYTNASATKSTPTTSTTTKSSTQTAKNTATATATPTPTSTPTLTPTPTKIPLDLNRGIRNKYTLLGGEKFLGKAIDLGKDTPTSIKGKYQEFEKGAIVYSEDTGAAFLSTPIFKKWLSLENMKTAPEILKNGDPPVQRTLLEVIGFPKEDYVSHSDGFETCEFICGTIYNNTNNNTQFAITGMIWNNYEDNIVNLGNPIADEIIIGGTNNLPEGRLQKFERGRIFYLPGMNAHSVFGAMDGYITDDLQYIDPTTGANDFVSYPKTDTNQYNGGTKQTFLTGAVYIDNTKPHIYLPGVIAATYEANDGPDGWLGELQSYNMTPGNTMFFQFSGGIIVSREGKTAAFKDMFMFINRYILLGDDDGTLTGKPDLYVKGTLTAYKNGVEYLSEDVGCGRDGNGNWDVGVNYRIKIADVLTPDITVKIKLEAYDDEDGSDGSDDDYGGIIEREYNIDNLWGYFEDSLKSAQTVDNNYTFQARYRLDKGQYKVWNQLPNDGNEVRSKLFWSFHNFSTNRLTYGQYAESFSDVDYDESVFWHPFNNAYYSSAYRDIAKSGNCFGMCSYALDSLYGNSIYQEPIFANYYSTTLDGQSLDYVGTVNNTLVEPYKSLIYDLNIKQGIQLGANTAFRYLKKALFGHVMSPMDCYDESLASYNDGDYPIINLSKDSRFQTSGHAVLPYMWSKNDPKFPDKWVIYVADPNRPFGSNPKNENSVIVIDPKNDTYKFKHSDSDTDEEAWSGRIFSVHYSLLKGEQKTPTKLLSSLTNMLYVYIGTCIAGPGTLCQVSSDYTTNKIIPLIPMGDTDTNKQPIYFSSGNGNSSFNITQSPGLPNNSNCQLAMDTVGFTSIIDIDGNSIPDNITFENMYTEGKRMTIKIPSNSSKKTADVLLQAAKKDRWIKFDNIIVSPGQTLSFKLFNGGKSLMIENSGPNTTAALTYRENFNGTDLVLNTVYINSGTNTFDFDGSVIVPFCPNTPTPKCTNTPTRRPTQTPTNTPTKAPTSTPTPTPTPIPKIVAKWQYNEGAGTSLSDGSGSGFTGKVYASWVPGISGKALEFNGSSQYVVVPNNSKLNFTAAQSYSISTWVLPKDVSKTQCVISKGSSWSSNTWWYGIWIINGKWAFGSRSDLYGTSSVIKDKYNHIAIVQNGAVNKRYIYVNGVLEATSSAINGESTGDLWIGGCKDTSKYFSGIVDETYIRNYAMTTNEVKKEYIKYKPDTIALWKFEEGTGTQINDSQSNINGTLKSNYSNPQWNWITTTTKDAATGNYTHALRFDPYYKDHVRVPANWRFNFSEYDSYQIFARVKIPSNRNKWQGVVTKGRNTSNFYGIWISDDNRWVMGGSGSKTKFGPAVTSGWHTITLGQDGPNGKRYLWVDYDLVIEDTITNGSTTDADFIIGGTDGTEEFFGGQLDWVEVRNSFYYIKWIPLN